MANYKIKICKFCGKSFIPTSSRQNVCKNDHYAPCPDCGKPVLIKTSYANFIKHGPRRCEDCRRKAISNSWQNMSDEKKQEIEEKKEETAIKRYGVKNAGRSKQANEKRLKTIQEKYGVESNVSQSSEIQEKIRKNSQDKYGVDHYSQDPEIRQHMKDGMIKKYGVDNPQKSKELKEKAKKTNQKRYGVENPAQNKEVQEKMKQTSIERYGAPYCMQDPEIVEKAKKTNFERYGAVNYIHSTEYLKSIITDGSKIEEYRKFNADPYKYVKENFDTIPTAEEIANKIGINKNGVYTYVSPNKELETPLFKKSLSTIEDEICNFIHNLDNTIVIIRNSRSIISPKELDIYLPDYKLAIECNPTATHNSTRPDPWGYEIKSKNYHQQKSFACEEKGIFLFHIFGYEWTNKKDIILSMIRNLLGKNKNVVYGRNTEIKEISQKDLNVFLNQNHRQGATNAKIRLGLIDKKSGELISVMSFSKLRSSIGKKEDSNENDMELSRFCSKLNTTVIGAASKLFKYFIDNYDYNKIISFSDIAHTKGTMYENLGFKKVSISQPTYAWIDFLTDKAINRVNCQKRHLRKLFNEPDLDIDNKSETEIMVEHGFVKVYDCGVIRWEYEKE